MKSQTTNLAENSANVQLSAMIYYWTSNMDGKGSFNTEHYAKVLKAKAQLIKQ